MKKQTQRPLKLRTETVRVLVTKDLIGVAGGGGLHLDTTTNECLGSNACGSRPQ